MNHFAHTTKAFSLGFLLGTFALLNATSGWSQTLRPGLWEITNKMQNMAHLEQVASQLQPQAQIAAMPVAEQHNLIQQALSRQDSSAAIAGPGSKSRQVCMTQEMINALLARSRQLSQGADCQTGNAIHGNQMNMSFSCSRMPAQGDGELTFINPEAYTMKMVASTNIKGQTRRIAMAASGQWVSSDCGGIKPLTLASK